MKNAAREQFGRLPYISEVGEAYYLDLLVWRTNKKLLKLPIFQEFCKALLFWTVNPLEGYSQRIPIFEEADDEEEEEEEEFNDQEDDDETIMYGKQEGDWFIPEEGLYSDSDSN